MFCISLLSGVSFRTYDITREFVTNAKTILHRPIDLLTAPSMRGPCIVRVQLNKRWGLYVTAAALLRRVRSIQLQKEQEKKRLNDQSKTVFIQHHICWHEFQQSHYYSAISYLLEFHVQRLHFEVTLGKYAQRKNVSR